MLIHSRLARARAALGAFGLVAGLAAGPNAAAQEVSLLAGAIESAAPWPRSYAWSFSYRERWLDWFSSTVSYLNQGHFPGHHRDGVTGQMWAQADLLDHHLTLAAGAGPFDYYDTTAAARGGSYSDNHGWAWIYSAGALWQPGPRPWFAEIRVDRTAPVRSIATTSISLGIGYRLQPDPGNGTGARSDGTHDTTEATLFYGKTVVNSFNSQQAHARAVEFRQSFGETLRASAGLVDEGDARLVRRGGAIFEGWLEPGFFDGRYSVGIGGGSYVAIDKYRPTPGRHVSGIVTLTMSYRFVDRWNARFDWHRIVTDYDRDTDIVLLGVGFRF